MGHYKGGQEQQQAVRTQSVFTNQPLLLSVVGITGKIKSCSFCKSAGHTLGMCCRKINVWKGTMLIRNKNKAKQRDDFIKQLQILYCHIQLISCLLTNINRMRYMKSEQERKGLFFMHDMQPEKN